MDGWKIAGKGRNSSRLVCDSLSSTLFFNAARFTLNGKEIRLRGPLGATDLFNPALPVAELSAGSLLLAIRRILQARDAPARGLSVAHVNALIIKTMLIGVHRFIGGHISFRFWFLPPHQMMPHSQRGIPHNRISQAESSRSS